MRFTTQRSAAFLVVVFLPLEEGGSIVQHSKSAIANSLRFGSYDRAPA